MKLILFILFFLTCKSLFSFTILIDPGHGGEDTGATSRYYFGKKKWKMVNEKDIVLELSKKIHEKLSKKYNSFLTRSVDRTVSLAERAELAEKIKADLFISVHINASVGSTGRGFETYYLDNHNDAAIKKVEEVENKNLQGEALVINQILTDLVIDRTVKSSKGLATSIHGEIQKVVAKDYRLVDRGVKPGLFYVLALTKRPAILLEVGFLSNSKELKKLLNEKFQEKYADAVVRGIDRYLAKNIKPEPILF